MNKLFLLTLLIITAPFVISVQPTQQYNKLLLDPFYVSSMTQNIQYNYTVDVITPDGISQVKTAILTLDAWINPTRTFNAWMNNIQCNTKNYTISTTYASAGRGVVTFDCTNAVLPNQINTVRFVVTGGNIGASTAWLDLTYMNSPAGSLELHGTEYIPGDVGKLFLQFLDSENQAVQNSECFLSVWYPNDTIFLNDTLMSKLQNASDGIYYKNFNVPATAGVYPASARCYKPLTFDYLAFPNYTTDGFESNSWTGGTGWANDTNAIPNYGWDIEDTVPLATIVTNASSSGPCYQGLYCAKYTGSYGFIERGVRFPTGVSAINITFATKFKGFQNQETCEFWIFDGNWHKLQIFNLAGNYTNNVWYVHSQYLPASQYELETILVGYYLSSAPSTGDECFVDSINIAVIAPNVTISNSTQYEILRGSGEVHVSNLYSQLNGSALTAEKVWNYATRNLTYYPDLTNYTFINEGVWNYPNRNLTYYQNFTQPQVDLTNYTLINQSIQDAMNTTNTMLIAVNKTLYNQTLTETDFIISTIILARENLTSEIQGVPLLVWSYSVRNLTYYQDMTNYSLINEGVWTNTVRNLTYYPPSIDLTNYTFLSQSVWNDTARYVHGVLI